MLTCFFQLPQIVLHLQIKVISLQSSEGKVWEKPLQRTVMQRERVKTIKVCLFICISSLVDNKDFIRTIRCVQTSLLKCWCSALMWFSYILRRSKSWQIMTRPSSSDIYVCFTELNWTGMMQHNPERVKSTLTLSLSFVSIHLFVPGSWSETGNKNQYNKQ